MKKLLEHEWLPHAQRLAVGMQGRIRHRREGRQNLVIGNERGHWWAFCMACKAGAKEQKSHVLLGGALRGPTSLDLPTDLARVAGSDYEGVVGGFLASKGVMFPMLPELWYSVQAKRLLLQADGKWHGRDLTGLSDRKWMNYGGAQFVGTPAARTVLTEDLFSMYKVRYALRDTDWSVCCTLGAGVHNAAVLAIKDCRVLAWAYDADRAGDTGAAGAIQRMRAFGPVQLRIRPPEGLDPKDMQCQEIRDLFKGE